MAFHSGLAGSEERHHAYGWKQPILGGANMVTNCFGLINEGTSLGITRRSMPAGGGFRTAEKYARQSGTRLAREETMKRSRVNEIIREGDAFIRSFGYIMPPFAYWSPAELEARRPAGIIDARLGWDITDYGVEKFEELGLFLFTVRNGRAEDLKRGSGMLYAEKIMISRKDQLSPMHRHNVKAEDIINRGGGQLVLELFMSHPDGSIDDRAEVRVPTDGVMRIMPAGSLLKLDPGESVTLMPGVWHAFWAEGSDVLIGEVSTVNDDLTDNIFREKIGRFSTIEEDEEPVHLLVSDYEAWLQ
jgi:D-lyxose ketol-isomerase